MYSRILVPVDTSYGDHSWLKVPLDNAFEYATRSMGTIHLVSAIPENLLKGYYPDLNAEDIVKPATAKLEKIRAALLPINAQVKLHVEIGGICSEILRVARDINADLIVMASHGPLVRDYWLGSNASYIALHAPCSVFVVRQ